MPLLVEQQDRGSGSASSLPSLVDGGVHDDLQTQTKHTNNDSWIVLLIFSRWLVGDGQDYHKRVGIVGRGGSYVDHMGKLLGSDLAGDPRRWPSVEREEEELRLWATMVGCAAEEGENES